MYDKAGKYKGEATSKGRNTNNREQQELGERNINNQTTGEREKEVNDVEEIKDRKKKGNQLREKNKITEIAIEDRQRSEREKERETNNGEDIRNNKNEYNREDKRNQVTGHKKAKVRQEQQEEQNGGRS